MAKKRVSGIGALDRQIKATRKRISDKKRAKAAVKSAAKKKTTLSKLQNELKRLGGRSGKRR